MALEEYENRYIDFLQSVTSCFLSRVRGNFATKVVHILWCDLVKTKMGSPERLPPPLSGVFGPKKYSWALRRRLKRWIENGQDVQKGLESPQLYLQYVSTCNNCCLCFLSKLTITLGIR